MFRGNPFNTLLLLFLTLTDNKNNQGKVDCIALRYYNTDLLLLASLKKHIFFYLLTYRTYYAIFYSVLLKNLSIKNLKSGINNSKRIPNTERRYKDGFLWRNARVSHYIIYKQNVLK